MQNSSAGSSLHLALPCLPCFIPLTQAKLGRTPIVAGPLPFRSVPPPPFIPEPVFVDLFRSPGIDSKPAGPVRQPYFSYRPARLYRLAKSMPEIRFLGPINVYKYGLSQAS